MAPRLKHALFRHYTWIVVVALFGFGLYLLLDGVQTDWGKAVPLVGVALSSVYFVQKQKLEELRLFQTLFREFNERYDRMNERLNALCESPLPSVHVPAPERDLLYDYFNLCSEEFLYYSLGYVPPQVWRAWYNGMKAFRKHEPIRRLWDDELRSESYYGLRFDQ